MLFMEAMKCQHEIDYGEEHVRNGMCYWFFHMFVDYSQQAPLVPDPNDTNAIDLFELKEAGKIIDY